MLQGIRDRAQSWIMWVIVILLIIPFALWGINQYFGPSIHVEVATVDGEPITQREFQETYQRQRYRMQAMLGDISQLDEGRLKQATLDQLIEQSLLVRTALDEGLRIGDQQLAAAIRGSQQFQVDGQFSQQRYEQVLRAQGFGPGGFEQNVRRSLLTEQVRAGLAGSAIVTPKEVDEALRLQGQRRSFSVLSIPSDAKRDQAPIPDSEVTAYYEAHKAAYRVPEQVVIRYIVLDHDRVAAGVEVDDDTLRRRYEAEKPNFKTPEERKASHILVTVKDGDDAAALKKAASIKSRLDQGEPFDQLAKSESDDPGSAAQGGDLGYFARGVMDKAFEEAAFSMQVGQVSEPVRSQFGYHIIRLDAVKPGSVKPFDAVREDLRREAQKEQGEQLFAAQADQFSNLVFENPDTLEPAAEAFGLKILEAGPFSREGGKDPLMRERAVLAAAFNEDVLAGNNSEPLELEGGRLLALRVKEHLPARQEPLEAVRDRVVAEIRSEHAQARAEALGKDILDKLRAGGSPELVASERQLSWDDFQDVGRGGKPGLAAEIQREVFRMPRPGEGEHAYAGVVLPSGGYAVVSLSAVTDGDPKASTEEERQAVERNLRRAYGEEAFASYLRSLRAGAEVQVFPDRM